MNHHSMLGRLISAHVSDRREDEHQVDEDAGGPDAGELTFNRIVRELTAVCQHCGTPMRPGLAIEQTYLVSVDFPGEPPSTGCTMSAGGPGTLVNCMKCSACGWSVT
jgi:hypothetical protein